MRLEKVLKGIADFSQDIEITNIVTDSRKVTIGSLFIAYEGVAVDGHDYINGAIKKGATAVVGEREIKGLTVPYFQVKNGRLAWAKTISNWYGNPEKKLKIVGITGTDGKTTTTNLIYHILKAAGKKVSMTSTINAVVGEESFDVGLHTSSPDPDKLWELLDKMVKSGSEYAVLEATSHGLEQNRFGDIEFEVGVLTNLAHDHLEFHKTIERYAEAKAKLFEKSKVSILNKHAEHLDVFRNAAVKDVTYDAEKEVSDVRYELEAEELIQKFSVELDDKWLEIKTSLLGTYNIENILAAIKVAKTLGIENEKIVKGIESLPALKGRFEIVPNKRGLTTIVDFAHTEQGMRNVLTLVKEKLVKKGNRIITVFGCNGERDRSKRAPMGETACELSDLVIVTTEDPRTEDVDQIFEDIQVGCEKAGAKLDESYFRIDDRKEAIGFAVNKLAKKGDFVMCLGKGHEKSMNIGGVETPWDERAVVEEILNRKL